MLHRMPVRMGPMTLQRGSKAIMLRAGRIPKMDGKPVELTLSELAQLRRSGIVPLEQAESPAFVNKPDPKNLEPETFEAEPTDEREVKAHPLARIKPRRVPKSEALD